MTRILSFYLHFSERVLYFPVGCFVVEDNLGGLLLPVSPLVFAVIAAALAVPHGSLHTP